VIRVGFRLIGGAAWQGGRNYLWNLLHAITAQPARRIQPVLLVSPDEDPGDLAMTGVERFTTGARLDSPRARTAGRVLKLVGRRNLVESHWLHRARIDVLSHAAPVAHAGRAVPTIAWVPDLQHKLLPHLASRWEHVMRDLLFREMVRDAAVVITSSETARADLQRFYGIPDARCRVLRFVSQPRLDRAPAIPLADLRARLGVPERFFHLPNQLWKHKNHALVVEALRQVPDVVVVATGPREDYRHPGMYEDLQARVRAAGVGDRFLHLGLVAFPDLIALMRHSVAVINPSRFEGWSTTVEEAKSLGKRVLVSDIPVHHEQAPPRASYFGVDDPAALAALLADAWATHAPDEDARAAAEAAAALPARTRAFAETYEAIVLDVAHGNR
jgi:glycosyltransferase involved in cell wall biosynthesis